MVDRETYKRTIGTFASGVAVVTTKLNDEINGMTATSICSVSVEPPLVLISVDNRHHTRDLIESSEKFAINFLRSDQAEISSLFASHGNEKADKLPDMSISGTVTGCPILNECLSFMECVVVDSLLSGDHTLFIGQVENGKVSEGKPLIYYSRDYWEIK